MNPHKLIPTPCHEDWNAMTNAERGKFCAKCNTKVHDLTDYSEDEILALKVQNGGKLCGAFRLSKNTPSAHLKPLALGAGIATLALASCKHEPQGEPPVIGTIALPPEERAPIEEKQTPENSEETCPTTSESPPANTIPNTLLLGKIAIPKQLDEPEPEHPPILRGQIHLDPKEQKLPEELLIIGEISAEETPNYS